MIRARSSAPPRRGRALPRQRKWRLSAVALGVLVAGAGALTVAHFGDVEKFLELAERFSARLLVLAVVAQCGTYVCAAAAWWLALRPAGSPLRFRTLVALAVGKLFTEQAVPAGGMSGTAFLLAALRRRGVPARASADTLVTALVSYYGAYLALALGSLGFLAVHHEASGWMVALTAVFAVVAVAIPGGAALMLHRGRRRLPRLLRRARGITAWIAEIRAAPAASAIRYGIMGEAFAAQLGVFLLDAATLSVMLAALGHPTAALTVLPAFVVASMVATLGPVPLGLGTFEATCTAMLHLLGVPFEAAVSAVLLLRGLTTWLPMIPGLWLARRELLGDGGRAVGGVRWDRFAGHG